MPHRKAKHTPPQGSSGGSGPSSASPSSLPPPSRSYGEAAVTHTPATSPSKPPRKGSHTPPPPSMQAGAATPPLKPATPQRPARPSPSPPPAPSSAADHTAVLTLRQMYDLLKLTASSNMEAAAVYLNMEDELRGFSGGSAEHTAAQDGEANVFHLHGAAPATAGSATPHRASFAPVHSNSPGAVLAVATTPRTGSAFGGTTSTPPVPSQRFVLAAVTHLSMLLSAADAQMRRDRSAMLHNSNTSNNNAGTGKGDRNAGGNGLPSVDKIALLAKVIAWFCIETAGDSATFSNIGTVGAGFLSRSSQNVSGRATPAVTGPRGRGGGGGYRGGAPHTRLSGRGGGNPMSSASTSTSRFGDWAGSRLSNSSFGGASNRALLPDDQLAEQLFRPAVELVTRLSTYYETTGEGGAHPTSRESDDVRLSALMLLCTVVARFPDADFHYNPFLPMLFPGEDIRRVAPASGALVGNGSHHPLLTPLVWDPSAAVRGAASVLLVLLLYKMQKILQHAEEPKRQQQSFVPMSMLSGAALMSVHDALYWVLDVGGPRTAHEGAAEGSMTSGGTPFVAVLPPAAREPKTPLLHVYSCAVVVTPYNRCPHSLEVVMNTLELPEVRRILHSVDGAASSLEYSAAMGFFANVFKNESLRTHVSAYFTLDASSSPLSPPTTAGPFGPRTKSKDPPSSQAKALTDSGSATTDGKASILSEILSHAKDRIEVWRCIVHISRLYPALIQQHFTELLKVSISVVNALVAQEEQLARIFQRNAVAATTGTTAAAHEREGHTNDPIVATSSPATSDGKSSAAQQQQHHHHVDPHSTDADAPAAAVAMQETVSPEAVAECLRAWLHFMGYVWKAFDGNPDDPALRPESQGDRATPAQKDMVFAKILYPAIVKFGGVVVTAAQDAKAHDGAAKVMVHGGVGGGSEEVRVMLLRCLAQMGDDFYRESAQVTPEVREVLVAFVKACAADWREKLRAEALSTMGVWAWQYPSLDAYGPMFIDVALAVLATDADTHTRTKAAFAISNLTCRLQDDTSATRQSPQHMALLCDAAMQLVSDNEPSVQGHGIRVICHLLQSLDFEELIAELDSSSTLMTMYMTRAPLGHRAAPASVPALPPPVAPGGSLADRNSERPVLGAEALRGLRGDDNSAEGPNGPHGHPPPSNAPQHVLEELRHAEPEPVTECVVEGFLRVLLFILTNKHLDAKRRWNAAYSLGEALAREVVFEGEPGGAVDCVYALMSVVEGDRYFKVRTQAATALAKISPTCLAGQFTTSDMSAEVMRALCVALGNSRSTEDFAQYKEQGALVAALKASLNKVMASATPSKELDKVFTEFQPLLKKEELL